MYALAFSIIGDCMDTNYFDNIPNFVKLALKYN